MKKLSSGRSPRWAFMEKFEVPQYDGDGNYLTRWRVIQTPWFAFYVHKFTGPDPRPTLHDHPWNFLSVVLKGGYTEHRMDPLTRDVNLHEVRRFNFVRANDAHAILHLHRNPTWTLLFVGRRRRTWGYWESVIEEDSGRYYPVWKWTEFDQHRHNDEFTAALARRKNK